MTISAVRRYDIPGSAVEYMPDPDQPVDRWMQCIDSANAATTLTIINDLYGGCPPRIIDPFCGTGSAAVAARMLEIPFFGMDLNPARACVAAAKASARLPDVPAESFTGSSLRLTRSVSPHRRRAFNEMVEADLRLMPDPAPGTRVWCGDALGPASWEPLPEGNDWAVYTSPPFVVASQPQSSSARHTWANKLLREAGLDHRTAEETHRPRSYFEMVALLLGRLHGRGRGLVILEHEPAGPEEYDVRELATRIDRLPGVSHVAPLVIAEFNPGRPFSLLMCDMG